MRLALWTGAFALLLVPLIAMRFTDEVNWTLSDFVFAAVMIGGAGLAFELAVRVTRNPSYRAGIAIAIVAAVLLIWAHLAVGVF
jgi:hypothetical protein